MVLDGDIIVLQSEQHPLKLSWGVSEILQVDLLQGFVVTPYGEGTTKDIDVKSFSFEDASQHLTFYFGTTLLCRGKSLGSKGNWSLGQ